MMKKYLLVILLLGCMWDARSQVPATIHVNNQDIFVNGINIAWFNWANDLATFNASTFTAAVRKVHADGGNAIRWWIHTDGTYSPEFANDSVSGIRSSNLANLNKALNIAYQNGVLVDLCLWSFDMLQSGKTTQVYTENRLMLTDTVYTRAYIRNALIPMVNYLKGNKGILCYEIFNEPEGMCNDVTWPGWTPAKYQVSIKDVQRFINLTAGAIHRTDPNVLVSNGSQLIMYCSDVAGTNYYRDDRLIAAGHDTLGTLDYYMVHYYTSNGTKFSLFREPASYWQLDKPIVIGEFPAIGFTSETPTISPVQAFNYAYTNGYAGAQPWTYTGGDANGSINDCALGMKSLEYNHRNAIDIVTDTGTYVYPPYVIKNIPPQTVYSGQTDTVTIGNLHEWFSDKVDSASLTFKVDSQNALANLIIDTLGNLKAVPTGDVPGIMTTTITATNTKGKTWFVSFTFSVVDTTNPNKLLFQKVYTSSAESYAHPASYLADTSQETFFSTDQSDDQWIIFKLDKEYSLQRLMLHWDTHHFAKQYEIKLSADSSNWKTVYSESNGDGGYDKILFSAVKAKYVMIHCLKRASLWDYKIFGVAGYTDRGSDTPPYIVNPIANITIVPGTTRTIYRINSVAKDNDMGDRLTYSFESGDGGAAPSWLNYIDSTYALRVSPQLADTGVYHIICKAMDIYGDFATDTFKVNVTMNPLSNPQVKTGSFDIKVFPNPAQNYITIMSNENNPGTTEISIIDLSGRVLFTRSVELSGSSYTMNLEDVPSGTYLLKWQNTDNTWIKRVQIIK